MKLYIKLSLTFNKAAPSFVLSAYIIGNLIRFRREVYEYKQTIYKSYLPQILIKTFLYTHHKSDGKPEFCSYSLETVFKSINQDLLK